MSFVSHKLLNISTVQTLMLHMTEIFNIKQDMKLLNISTIQTLMLHMTETFNIKQDMKCILINKTD